MLSLQNESVHIQDHIFPENYEKKNYHITRDDIESLKKFMDCLGITYLTAKAEADDLIGCLYRDGIITACLSDDKDMLAKGCDILININKITAPPDSIRQYDITIRKFDLNKILMDLNLTRHQFVDLCILLGCDYYTCPFNLQPSQLYDLFIQFPSIEEFVENYKDGEYKHHLNKLIDCRRFFMDLNENTDIREFKIPDINFQVVSQYFRNIGYPLNHSDCAHFAKYINNVNIFLNQLRELKN